MRSYPLPQSEPWRRDRLAHVSFLVSLFATSGAALLFFAASANAPAQSNPAAAPPSHMHSRSHKKPTAATLPPQPVLPPAPVVPPPPNWPANDLPGAASVVFDSRGLLVVASNSSLLQILKEVSLQTGAKVDGLDGDQRIFGTYGPAPVREVLAQLLDGSGYDVLMIGDRGEGTPRRIELSGRSGAAPKSVANNNPAPSGNDDSDDQPESQAEPEPPQAVPGPNGPPVPIRTPQQMMQEIQERQRQQQQQNGQQNPQN